MHWPLKQPSPGWQSQAVVQGPPASLNVPESAGAPESVRFPASLEFPESVAPESEAFPESLGVPESVGVPESEAAPESSPEPASAGVPESVEVEPSSFPTGFAEQLQPFEATSTAKATATKPAPIQVFRMNPPRFGPRENGRRVASNAMP